MNFQGHLTFVGYHVCSTVDLVLSSEATLLDPAIIQYLSLLELNILLEHKSVLLKLFVNNYKEQCSTDSNFLNWIKFCKKQTTYILKETTKDIFVQKLEEKTDILETKLENHKSGIDYFVKEIQNIFPN